MSLGTQIITGCGISGQVGGSNVHGSAILGVGFTTAECYAYIEAQAFHAIGMNQSACEILMHTDAAKRAMDRGAKLPDCAPPAVVYQTIEVPGPTIVKEVPIQAVGDVTCDAAPAPNKHTKKRVTAKPKTVVPLQSVPSPGCTPPSDYRPLAVPQ